MIIGFYGVAGVGKSTAAKMLAEEGWVSRPFGAPLKAMGEAFMLAQGGDAREVAHALDGAGWARPNRYFGGASPAAAMRKLDLEWARELNPDFWVEAWRRGLPIGRSVVADDVQLLNEAAAIRQLGGKLVRIKGISRHPLPSNAFSRALDVETLEADATIINDGGLGALWRNVMALAA